MIAKAINQQCEHDRRWSAYSQRDLAMAIGRDDSTISQWVRSGLPRSRAGRNRYRYCLPCVFAWLVQRGAIQLPGSAETSDELLVTGGDSPNLERYRLARAQHAELDLDERRKELHPRQTVRDMLARIAARFKRIGETIGKRYGNEAGLVIREALIESQRDVDETIGGNGHFHEEAKGE